MKNPSSRKAPTVKSIDYILDIARTRRRRRTEQDGMESFNQMLITVILKMVHLTWSISRFAEVIN